MEIRVPRPVHGGEVRVESLHVAGLSVLDPTAAEVVPVVVVGASVIVIVIETLKDITFR